MATIRDIKDALSEVGVDVYHFFAPEERSDRFIIWAETQVGSNVEADDEIDVQVPTGQIYFYTTHEYDQTVNEISLALMEHDIGFSIGSIGYDDMLKMIVYQFNWEVVCGAGEIY